MTKTAGESLVPHIPVSPAIEIKVVNADHSLRLTETEWTDGLRHLEIFLG